jgi:xylan 1,4-beta-xylosidase
VRNRSHAALLTGLLLGGLLLCSSEVAFASGGRGGTATFAYVSYRGHDPADESFPLAAGEYRNPILPGFQPDPSIVRVHDDYYLTNSSFTFFPGLPIYHSRDLVNWDQIGNAIDRPEQFHFAGLGIARAIFAPTLRWHAGRFYIVGTCVDCGGTFLIDAVDPAGPWSDPHWLPVIDGIDPDLFFDTDGRVWIAYNGAPAGPPAYEGHRAIWLQELDLATGTARGERVLIVNGGVNFALRPIWIEGPHLIKRNAAYYLIAAEGGTASQHSEVVFRSARIDGPYAPAPNNPILTQRDLDPARPFPITAAGHADVVQTPDGDWWSVFLATRPYRDNLSNLGRETFLLPVNWESEWPQILPPKIPVPRVVARPALPAGPPVDRSRWRDTFVGHRLEADWEMIRTPDERWYRVTAGGLSLESRPVSISGRGNPTFLGKRQRDVDAVFETEMRYQPERAGDCAGLVAFADEQHHDFIGLCATSTGSEIVVTQRNGAGDPDEGVRMAWRAIGSRGKPIRLRISAHGAAYDFSYAIGASWQTLLAAADGSILASEPTNQFTGTLLGVYAVRGR